MSMIPEDAIERLKKILEMLPLNSQERSIHVQRIADTYRCSVDTVQRELQKHRAQSRKARKDQGIARWENQQEFIGWIEIIAAIKHRSTNKKSHHISTNQAIAMAERGFRDSQNGQWIQIPQGQLTRQTCNRWLKSMGLNHSRTWESPSVRFGASAPNEVWQFDLSPSDAYYLDKEKGIIEDNSWRPKKAHEHRPKLTLYSVIDDFSRVEYMEYHLCYGEDVETALRFLYRAMASKEDPSFPFQGVPSTIYMDNGPIAKSGIFLQVMGRLNITIKLHETPEQAKGRTAARSKGKIERSFRTFKNSFESLFHFHKPQTLAQANEYLCGHLLNVAYSSHPLWNEKRIEVWHQNLPKEGIRKICDWEAYRDLARKPCNRRVSNDRLVIFDHQHYLVDDEFRGKQVEVWCGLLDEGLFIRTPDGTIRGPYKPAPVPLPFGKFHKPKKSQLDLRREKVINLARNIDIPKESVFVDNRVQEDQKRDFLVPGETIAPQSPTGALYFVNPFTAKQAIFKEFGIPLGRLSQQQRQKIDQILQTTLRRDKVMSEVKKIIDELTQNASRNS